MGSLLFFIEGLIVSSFLVEKATIYRYSIFNRLYIKERLFNPFMSAKIRVSTKLAIKLPEDKKTYK
jgi:hypothetical protein